MSQLCNGSGIIPDPDRGSGDGPYWDTMCDGCKNCQASKIMKGGCVRDDWGPKIPEIPNSPAPEPPQQPDLDEVVSKVLLPVLFEVEGQRGQTERYTVKCEVLINGSTVTLAPQGSGGPAKLTFSKHALETALGMLKA